MEDFAAILVAARERLRITQAQLAASAGLTPSYVCLLENRKKPPPSDTVCERLAAALGIPARDMLAVAHLQRSPATVRQRMRALSGKLSREKRSRHRLLESMLSPLLVASPTGWLENAVEWIGGGAARRRRLREVLVTLGRRHQHQAEAVSRIVEDLPERDRQLLLEALPRLLSERDRRGAAPAAPGPDLFYTLPPPGGIPEKPFLLAWAGAPAGDDVLPGDLLLVDPSLEPRAGDLVLERGADRSPVLRRVQTAGGDGEPGAAEGGSLPGAPGREHPRVVVEVRRPLRPRP